MSDVVDRAIVEWANDQLEDKGLPRDATGVRFGYFIGCYSSWTCDYDVTATVMREGGADVDTGSVYWNDLLEALPAYVAAQDAMYEEHSHSHGRSDESEFEVSW